MKYNLTICLCSLSLPLSSPSNIYILTAKRTAKEHVEQLLGTDIS